MLVYSIFGDDADSERTDVGEPTIYAGRKVLERIQRASGTFFHPARRFLLLLSVCRQTGDYGRKLKTSCRLDWRKQYPDSGFFTTAIYEIDINSLTIRDKHIN